MLAIFLRQDYPELARVVHSLSASVTTVFLFTRLCTYDAILLEIRPGPVLTGRIIYSIY